MEKKSTYSEKLKDPRWQKLRLKVLERDNWTCQKCLSTTKTLHVHHRRYIKDAEPWDYDEDLLVTLCHECHESEADDMQFGIEWITEILKERFFGKQLQTLCIGFGSYKHPSKDLNESAGAILYFLTREDMVKEAHEKYLVEMEKLRNG